MAFEVNFDGIVGPNHNYAGLSLGNIASQRHSQASSKPKQAALQGLAKMKALSDMGIPQAVLPPHQRPNVKLLREMGYSGSDGKILQQVWKENPNLAIACFSASAMWTANAATVSPWADTADGKTHFTPANLSAMFHRSFESEFSGRTLSTIFSDTNYFAHHNALPAGIHLGDEGAANHTRFCNAHSNAGLGLFVYGASALDKQLPRPSKYPARQTLEASQAIARTHGLNDSNTVFAQQNPAIIDAGVFHNDVISVGNTNLYFYHQQTFIDNQKVINEIAEKSQKLGIDMYFIEVPTDEVSVEDAVSTYLFNTQLINIADGGTDFIIIAPIECSENVAVNSYLTKLVNDSSNPISNIHYFDLRQSMRNGGGPACLRLRVAMNSEQQNSINANVFINDNLYAQLCDWVEKHYRDELCTTDLQDPSIIDEFHGCLDELSQLLKLGSIYDFQQT